MFEIHRTRIQGLGYCQVEPNLWRVADIHDGITYTPRCVGPHYRTKTELLADFDRYARDAWGYGATGDGMLRDYLVIVNEAPDDGLCLRNIHIQAAGVQDARQRALALDPVARIEAVYEKVA